ncbi:MAG: YceD family protein [Endomicrobia bacterium]|nr:YceD family protein [Endomicrobiia bacterium]
MKQLIFNTSDFIKSDTVERKIGKFEVDIGYSSEIAVSFKLIKISDDKVYVSGAVDGHADMECARCLCVYRHPVELFIEAEMDFLNGEVDIDEEIRQRIILDLPVKPLCNQDCLGICPECGKHNAENDKCSCSSKNDEEFAKNRWESLFKKNGR